MPLVVVVEPPVAALSLEQAKLHLRVDHEDEDDQIKACIAAVEAHVGGPDGWLGRSLAPQTLEWQGDSFPTFQEDGIPLICPPVVELEGLTYLDAQGATQELLLSTLRLYGTVAFCAPGQRWPIALRRPASVRLRYRAGYEEGQLPAPIMHALKLMVGDLFEHRGTVSLTPAMRIPMSTTVEALLMPFRAWVS